MNALYIIMVVVFLAAQSMHSKKYIRVNDGRGPFIYTSILALAAAATFTFLGLGKLDFTRDTLIYSVGFSLSYSLCSIFGFYAIKVGSMALTSLFTSYSLIIPTLCGIIMFDEPVTKWLVIGAAFLFVSIALVNLPQKGSNLKISFKWIVCVFLAFAGNGLCSSVQTIQQRTFDGNYGNEFMIIALIMSSAIFFIVALVAERKDIVISIKKGAVLGASSGCINAFVNLFVMILVMSMNASIAYPLISVGGIVATALVSIFIYKERLSALQTVGFVFGIGAIVFLNI